MSRAETPALTRESVEKMEAGPEMDALVAERVMGWTDFKMAAECGRLHGIPPGSDRNYGECLRRYSSVMAQAWDVVERMHALGFCFNLDKCAADDREQPPPMVTFMRDGHHINDHYQADRRDWHASGPVPYAICRAALLSTL
jgi:hypothetical protein